MTKQPIEIFEEYRAGMNFKSSLGKRGMYEQNRINERFYIGDQWYGAQCGNERPLVRHNIIKRIGDYKMSQVLSVPTKVEFSAEGIPTNNDFILSRNSITNSDTDDITVMTSAFSKYFDTTAERVNFGELQDKVLHNAYITGTGVLYTYWDSEVQTGLYADDFKTVKINGDICCQVLDIEDVYFGDPYVEDVEEQPYIIISTTVDISTALREARLYGADISTLRRIEESQSDGKITVLTKLFKEYKKNKGYTIKCIKVCENEIIRPLFDTELKMYPISVFKWERKNNSAYGESEITYLVPNQIAINRMITANVWSAMTTGMPIMLVNGDTVTGKITNEPGQIIKVFGSNEDVAGAVKYVTPPSFEKNYDQSVNSLINNTLTQSGANEVALGDSRADNATALMTMRTAALMPLQIVKNRFYSFVELTARIWAQFWILKYGNRKIKIKDENGIWYLDFNAERYKDLIINTNVNVLSETTYTDKERVDILLSLYDKGIINREQLVVRLPDGMVSDRSSLFENNITEVAENDGESNLP